MANSQLLPAEKKQEGLIRRKADAVQLPVVTYSLLDPMHYAFEYELGENVTIRMEESESASGNSDFVDVEFDDSIPESNRVFYAVAAASGVLTGALSFAKLSEEQLAQVDKWKEAEWKPLVIHAAGLVGCKKKDYKSASKYLVNQAVKRVKKNETAKGYMTVLTAHPTTAGLVFSLITQFSGKLCCITEEGEIILKNPPKHYFVGKTNSEKIVSAVLYWFYELAANQAESKRNLIANLGLKGELLRKIKEFVNLLNGQSILDNREQSEIAFSNWLRKTIGDANLDSLQDNDENAALAIKLMKMALNMGTDAFPVLINECVVRSLYMVIRLCDVVKTRHITKFEELAEVPACEILPEDDRLLSGMCLAASASFVTLNLSVAVLKAIAESKTGDRTFLSAFYAELNLPAIGRFFFACVKDSKYWGDDIKLVFQRRPKEHNRADNVHDSDYDDSAFVTMSFNPLQARILYCLENLAVRKDIERTADKKMVAKKQLWLEKWRANIVAGANGTPDMENSFFLEDEDALYEGIYQLSKDKSNYAWFYLLTQELALFKPYFTLGCDADSDFRKLKLQYDYVSDQFIRRQTIASQAELDSIKATYKKYMDYMSGKMVKTIAGVAGGTAVTALTGGLALTYAPAIAAMIAGEAVVGLHGAALTSASLAFVGGGSLAAGGLGMAGGTAIITGGGSLIGLAGSGGVSAVVALMSTSDDYWMRQSAKMLTHCKCTLCDTLQQKQIAENLLRQVESTMNYVTAELNELKQEDNDLDKEYIKRLESYLNCLKKVKTEIHKLIK